MKFHFELNEGLNYSLQVFIQNSQMAFETLDSKELRIEQGLNRNTCA